MGDYVLPQGADFPNFSISNFHTPELEHHVAFRMPLLLLAAAIGFDKLLKNWRFAAFAVEGEKRRVMAPAVDISIVFEITVIGPKHGRA